MLSKVGIIAGQGNLPLHLARACQESGIPYYVLALRGFAAADDMASFPHTWLSLGQVGRALEVMDEHHIQEVVMAGAVKRPSLEALGIDKVGLKLLSRLSWQRCRGDDTVLRGIAHFLEEKGFRVVSSQDVLACAASSKKGAQTGSQDINPSASDLFLGDKGPLTNRRPLKEELAWAREGLRLLAALAPFDVGQSLVMQEGRVLGIEGAEGSDGLLMRCQRLMMPKGPKPFFVKSAKPGQDLRFDRPVMGLETIEKLSSYGYGGAFFEAHNVMILDKENTCMQAQHKGLFLYGCDLKSDFFKAGSPGVLS